MENGKYLRRTRKENLERTNIYYKKLARKDLITWEIGVWIRSWKIGNDR